MHHTTNERDVVQGIVGIYHLLPDFLGCIPPREYKSHCFTAFWRNLTLTFFSPNNDLSNSKRSYTPYISTQLSLISPHHHKINHMSLLSIRVHPHALMYHFLKLSVHDGQNINSTQFKKLSLALLQVLIP